MTTPADELPYTCPTPCDEDCGLDCHEWHEVSYRRDHDAATCERLAREAIDEEFAVARAILGTGSQP